MPPKPPSFFRLHILPALLVLIIPVFSAWFFSYAESWQDGEMLTMIRRGVEKSNLSASEKTLTVSYFERTPVSRIMASGEKDERTLYYQAQFKSTELSYGIFRWMKRTAWICLGTIAATLLIVGVSVGFSFESHEAQYWSLRVGWPVLRTSAAIQVLGQGVLAVALSYWVTAIWMNVYAIKLILIVALLAGGAVLALWKAIFAQMDDRLEVEGELIDEQDAPSLWQRVRDMAARLSTAPPDRIVAGVVPNFFVTEHPVTIGPQTLAGRTLYVSLPLLKVLATDEADAILGHELAHFSGQDTLWSKKIAPLKTKFAIYLAMLGQGLSLVIAHFMHAFWKLYELSINRLSRDREFRADRLGAELTSPEAAKRALIKTTSYCDFRAETELAIVRREEVDEGLNLALKLEQGFPAALAAFATNTKSIDERVPHPFDSHPTLSNRLERLGFEPRAALQDEALQQPAGDSWYHAITTAPAVEDRLWTQQQEAIQSFHQEDLLWRMLGTTEEQIAALSKRFPRVVLAGKKGGQAVIDFDRIELAGWGAPLFYRDISHAEVKESWGRRLLVLTHQGRKTSINLKHYPGPPLLLDVFGHYYGRHKTAEARSKETPAA